MKAGFTFIEVIIVIALILILTTFATINLLGSKHEASLQASVTPLVSDLKQQQLKSMIGDTQGEENSTSYGIYFSATSYTLFRDTYTPEDPSNLEISLGDNIEVVNPNYSVSFTKGSGQIENAIVIELQNSVTNEQKTIELNKSGTIISIN